MNFINKVDVKYNNIYAETKKKARFRKPARSKEEIQNQKHLDDLKRQLKNKKKKNDFSIFENLLTCIHTKFNDDKLIINYFKSDTKKIRLASKYKCSQKNCLFCKRSKLLKNIYKKNIMFNNGNDVQTEKLFVTISLENIGIKDLKNIESFQYKVKKEKQKIKDFFNLRNLTFFGAVEIANKLHFHIIVNDFHRYGFDVLSSEIRSLFGYTDIKKFTTNTENLKRIIQKLQNELKKNIELFTRNEIEKKINDIKKTISNISKKDNQNNNETKEKIQEKTFDYISKIFEYVSKTYDFDTEKKDKLQQNYIDINTSDFLAFKNIKNITDTEINFYKTAINKYNVSTIFNTLQSLDTIKQSNLLKFASEKNGIYYFFLLLFRNYKHFTGKIISDRLDKHQKKYIELNKLDDNFFKTKHKNIFEFDLKNKFQIEFESIKNDTLISIWKNYFISKIKTYKKLSETLEKILITSETIENNKTRVYSNFFVTSPFKKIFFSNISLLSENKIMGIKNNNKTTKIENMKYDKAKAISNKIKDSQDVFTIENNINLTGRFSNVKISKLANLFYKNSIEKINKTLKRSDFDKKEIIEFLEISVKNKVIRSLNKYKKKATEYDYNNRVTELYNEKIRNIKKFIQLNYK